MTIIFVLGGSTVAGALLGLAAVYVALTFSRDHTEGIGPLF